MSRIGGTNSRRGPRRCVATLAAAAVLVTVGLAPGCASRNYPDPAGPALRLDRPAARAAFPRTLRLVTLNIEHGRRVEAAIAALQAHPDLRDVDLLFLQEMTGTGVEAMAAALSLAAAYYPASNRGGRDSGCAVLSRWAIERSWKVPLPHQSRTTGESRAAVGTRITIGDRVVRAYSVHISSRFALRPSQRTDQVEAVLADVASSPEPVILAGDLNGHGIGRHFEEAGFTWVSRDAGPSLMGFSIDHVFVRGLPEMTARSGVAHDVRDASDHRPVWAALEFSR